MSAPNDSLADDLPSESETGTSEEASGSEDDGISWIAWFCSLKGNEFFCEVDEDFLREDFNLGGLPQEVEHFDYALDLILDADSPNNEILTDEQHEVVETAAELLYGLVHCRYILTSRGMAAMVEKYKLGEFGRCPRVLCGGQHCLPVGDSDVPHESTVKLFCPKCEDLYHPRSRSQARIDGAFFGTTFPHLLLMTYPALKPERETEVYVPRVFGFKLHSGPGGEVAAAPVSSGGPARTAAQNGRRDAGL